MAERDYILDEYAAKSLGPVMKREVAQAAQYEQQITALERSLAFELKNIREKVVLYKEKKELVEDHIRLATQENWLNAPMVIRALGRSIEMVHEVERKIPRIWSQLDDIKNAYKLGQRRARVLQIDMEWKAKPDFEQWRLTLLGKGPLSTNQMKREWLRLVWRILLVCLAVLFFLSLCRAITRRS